MDTRPEIRLGSSPRMRGTLSAAADVIVFVGIIPAYAGNTEDEEIRCPRVEDHPRVCGEHVFDGVQNCGVRGSSPRMRGTRPAIARCPGLPGIIPAYAGNTVLAASRSGSARDHPRVCGEHDFETCCRAVNMGSSPRMRGTLLSIVGH